MSLSNPHPKLNEFLYIVILFMTIFPFINSKVSNANVIPLENRRHVKDMT
ncbi:hypothetical protein JHK86_055559 [Glycine max]|nr:hypothetical protein JHK86_055559 [Glycine max]